MSLHMLMLIFPKCYRDTLEVFLVFLKWVSLFATVQDEMGSESYLSDFTSVIKSVIGQYMRTLLR